MRSKLTLLAIALLTPTLWATSYVMVSDETLTDQARLVVVGHVERVENIVASPPYTRFHISAERLLKGSFGGDTISVDVLGGEYPDGSRLVLADPISFSPRDRLLLFLVPRADRSYGVLHLGLGAFWEYQVGDRKVARRFLGDSLEIGSTLSSSQPDHQLRDFDRFADWVRDYSLGLKGPVDYFVDPSEIQMPAVSAFRLGSQPARHDSFDKGETVEWVAYEGGQPGLTGGGTEELEAAFEAWNADLNTNINQALVGTTASNPGLGNPDGVNNVSFDDPMNDVDGTFTCPGGGILGFGGAIFGTPLHTFNDQEFFTVLETFLIMNDGVECRFSGVGGPALAAEVYAHEIGHALLLGHSCGQYQACLDPVKDDALMRATAHDDGRGARLGIDDRRAIALLYPNSTAAFARAIFPQYINGEISGEPNRTRVVVRNNGIQPDIGRINFQNASGGAQQVPVSIGGSAPAGTASFVAFDIPPGGVFDVETAGTGALVSGSIEVISDLGAASRLEATEVFTVLGNFVSVPSATLAALQQVFVSVNGGENTGFAAYNPHGSPLDLDLCLIDDEGNEQATAALSLAARERVAIFLDDPALFQNFLQQAGNNFTGTMTVATTNGEVVAVLGLLQKIGSGAEGELIAVETSTKVAHPEN